MNDDKIKVKGEIFWASLAKPNAFSVAQGTPKYTFDLCNLSDAACRALESLGITIKNDSVKKPEQGKYITFSSKNPIRAYSPDGDEIHSLVGNKSEATVLTGSYSWKFANKKGVSASAIKVVISKLETYAPMSNLVDDVDAL